MTAWRVPVQPGELRACTRCPELLYFQPVPWREEPRRWNWAYCPLCRITMRQTLTGCRPPVGNDPLLTPVDYQLEAMAANE